jgi:hypothetical protein
MQLEQTKILDMIASGKITAQEGASLLEALNSGGPSREGFRWDWHHHHHPHSGDQPLGGCAEKGRLLRVRVLDTQTDQPLINLGLPMGLLRWREKMNKIFSNKFKNGFFDVENIVEGLEGKIAEATDEKLNKKIEVWVE